MLQLALAAMITAPDYTADFKADLASCGIAPSRAVVEYRDDWQDYETGVAGSEPVSDRQITCLASAAAKHGYFVEFTDSGLNRRYVDAYLPMQQMAGVQMWRDWLKAHGRLDGLPRYDAGRETLDRFAVRLETFCGVAPHSVLRALSPTFLTFDASGMRLPFDDKVQCAMPAAGASNLGAQGVSFGFLGNEQADPAPR